MSNIEGIRFAETPEQRRRREAVAERKFRIGELSNIDWEARRKDEQAAADELRRKLGGF